MVFFVRFITASAGSSIKITKIRNTAAITGKVECSYPLKSPGLTVGSIFNGLCPDMHLLKK